MEDKKIRVAIAHGDTNGVGYELIFKTFMNEAMLDLCTPIIYGSPKVATYHRKALGLDTNFSIISSASEAQDGRLNLLTVFDDDLKVEFGVPCEEASRAALRALDRAITDYKDGLYDVLVTAPIDPAYMHIDGFDYTNERFVEMCLGDGSDRLALPLTLSQGFRVAMMTEDTPLSEVPACITEERVTQRLRLFVDTLSRDFRISMPRVAVLALNPADSAVKRGAEEQVALIPAIEKVVEEGRQVFGPYQADRFFAEGQYTAFDGILAMYRDQALAAVKTLVPEGNVRFLAGLPLIATSPDMDPCYGLAGQGKVDAQSMRNAIYAALDAHRNRQMHDEPLSHPLPKLYHERRDDSEKVRFSIPKRHDTPNKGREVSSLDRGNTSHQQHQ